MGGRGQQAGRSHRGGDGRGVGDAAHLHVAPGGEFQGAGPESVGGVCQGLELGAGDHPAGQSDPGQCAVGGMVHVQGAGAGVIVTGAGHPTTVRRGRGVSGLRG